MNTENTHPNATQGNQNSRPTHIVRKKVGHGKRTDFETLGVAWDRGDGSLYIKPYGTQIIEGGFYVFPVSADQEGGQ
jgi:hypothetical protein